MAGYNEASLKARAADYMHKAKVMRQIQSIKLARVEKWDNRLNYSTIIVSALVTMISFFGIKNIHALFLSTRITLEKFEFSFNFLVLALLIAAFLQMTLNLKERAANYLHGIRAISEFITVLDNIVVIDGAPNTQCEHLIEVLSHRYNAVNSILPANSDAEWVAAKKALETKGG